MTKRKYDFAGWVTKNDIRCSDGVVIKHDAFKNNDGQKVPLVWNHDYKSPANVLGHVMLKNLKHGVYGYGFFNETDEATNAKELIRNGDISSMSIGARSLKKAGSNVTHGLIYEVSLVLAGANPGALIETVMSHSDDGTNSGETAIVYTGNLIHSADDVVEDETEINHSEGDDNMSEKKTVGDVMKTLNEEQTQAVEMVIEEIVESYEDDLDELEQNIEGDDTIMKHNVFEGAINEKEQTNELKHSMTEILLAAKDANVSSLKKYMSEESDSDESIKHGINSIEMLFPESEHSTNGNVPIIYRDPNTAYEQILKGVTKSPFSKVRTLIADLTQDEARAKGYIKGRMKKEQFFSLIKRATGPATIYKKQKLDRDDIIDITDFDIVSFMNREMRFMLEEELARAILVGDGREIDDEDKIDEKHIRPIVTDHEFFTIQAQYTDAADFIEKFINAMKDYRGSGLPTLYMDPILITQIKLLKGTDGRFLFGATPPSNATIATILGVNNIVTTSFMSGKGALAVNLKDYSLGATKGGQVTTFDDFDIDFNQYKYLIETRLSGALTMPKSAIHLAETVVTGANNTDGGMTFGEREEDKVTEPQE